MSELSALQDEPDLIINGVHFGRGDSYIALNPSLHLFHKTDGVKCWRITENSLEETDADGVLYSRETYLVQWNSTTSSYRLGADELLTTHKNRVYFYWRGDQATKGYSPLPPTIEADDPPVERIVQWSEPPAFLRLFSGSLVVHLGARGVLGDNPRLYILRGEIEEETHLYEVTLSRTSLRSRTSFVLFCPKDKSSTIWHGRVSNSLCRDLIRNAVRKVFRSQDTQEVEEDRDDSEFLKMFPVEQEDHFKVALTKDTSQTPKLFYFNDITGIFLASEVEYNLRSVHVTPFPFLQSHLYTAIQPATFLLDDCDDLWIWQGWERARENEAFKSECFAKAIEYTKEKSKRSQKLVKVQKVTAGFEPHAFTNLFPVWVKRDDIVQLQIKDGVSPHTLIESISDEDSFKNSVK